MMSCKSSGIVKFKLSLFACLVLLVIKFLIKYKCVYIFIFCALHEGHGPKRMEEIKE